MFQQFCEFVADQHLFSSLFVINDMLSSQQTLAANSPAVIPLLDIYKQHVDNTDVRSECLSKRSLSATKLIVSLRLMHDQTQFTNAPPTKLVPLKNPNIPISKNYLINIGTQAQANIFPNILNNIKDEIQMSQQNKQICVSKSSKSVVNQSWPECNSSVVFTQSLIQQKPILKKFQISNNKPKISKFEIIHKQKQSKHNKQQLLHQYLTPKSIKQVDDKNDKNKNKNQLEQFMQSTQTKDQKYIDIKIISQNIKQNQQKQQHQIRQFSPQIYVYQAVNSRYQQQQHSQNFSNQQPEQHQSQQDQFEQKPIEEQETHLRSHSRSIKPISSSNLKINSGILSVHQVLKTNRQNHSKQSKRQGHFAQFSSRVEEQISNIQKQLNQLKGRNQQSRGKNANEIRRNKNKDFSEQKSNEIHLRQKPSTNLNNRKSSTKLLRFDISVGCNVSPKPTNQLLTASRTVNVRNDSRPTILSRQKQQQKKDKFSHQKNKQKRSLQSFQKAMQIAKPRHRELLTTRIAKYY